MSKNIYEVLDTYEKGIDDNVKPAKQLPKKEKRKEEKILREAYGDTVQKEKHKPGFVERQPPVKDDYKSGEKRPYDRHSGTGRQAFGNPQKKGGYGKGNEGKVQCKDYEGMISDDLEERLEKVEEGEEVIDDQAPKTNTKNSKPKKKKKKSKLSYDEETFPSL